MTEREEKIRCPKCEWEPDGGAHWICNCGHVWNTFATQGQCPRCGKVHKHTCCPKCHKWSPHADWYVDLLGISLEIEEMLEEPLEP